MKDVINDKIIEKAVKEINDYYDYEYPNSRYGYMLAETFSTKGIVKPNDLYALVSRLQGLGLIQIKGDDLSIVRLDACKTYLLLRQKEKSESKKTRRISIIALIVSAFTFLSNFIFNLLNILLKQ